MSHHCHDEHHHGHSHDGADHEHSDDVTPALQFSLYQHINFDEVTALNEAVYGSGRAVVRKTWAERLAPEPEVASDVDEQLLINVPYVFFLFLSYLALPEVLLLAYGFLLFSCVFTFLWGCDVLAAVRRGRLAREKRLRK